jgi:hypothetical protein
MEDADLPENFPAQPAIDFGDVGTFEEQGESFHQIRAGLFDGGALARDVELGTKCHVTIVFPFDDGSQAQGLQDDPSLQQRAQVTAPSNRVVEWAAGRCRSSLDTPPVGRSGR